MKTLPALNVKAIPATRVVKEGTDLHQFLAADQKIIAGGIAQWVQSVAQQRDAEALRAGNPKVRLISIDGTTGKTGNNRSGFRPGTIPQARQSVRILYIGKELAEIANRLAPILMRVIEETFPDSKTGRLSTKWAWWVQRRTDKMGGGVGSDRVGRRVPSDIGIYDVLWLVPDDPGAPATYAWFANYNAKKRFGYKYNIVRKTIHELDAATNKVVKRKVHRMRKRMRGFAGEASRRMRGAKTPGVVVRAVMIRDHLSGPTSKSKHGVPAIRVAFRSNLTTAVEK